MTLIQAIILGIIQGLTEFLPVSSSGHLALFERTFGLTEGSMTFNVAVHLGTLFAVVFIYRRDILTLLRRPFQKYCWLVVIATLPAVAAGLFFGDFFETVAETPYLLALGFLITGVALLYSDSARAGSKKSKDITILDAALIGLSQAVAIAPGISRSGSTVSASVSRGIKREDAARFSFMMSIPAILGAAVLETAKSLGGNPAVAADPACLAAGFVTAALVGFLSVSFMIRLIIAGKLSGFAYYVFAVAAFILTDTLVFGGKLLG
jgi:undecaprenyl-diphosphatase